MKDKGLKEELYKIINDFIKYYELRWEIFRLNLVESLAQLYTRVFSIFLIWLIIPIFLMFLFIALALYLGKIWGAYYLGFLAVGGIIFVIGILILLFRKVLITNPLVNALISAFFEAERQGETKKNNYESKQSTDKDTKRPSAL